MKINKHLSVLILILIGFSSYAQNGTDTVLNVKDFNQKMQSVSKKQVLDVRTPEEFQSGHIKGAANINFYDDDFVQQLKKLDKKTPVFVYCRSGKRSGKAAKQLQELGFKTIYDLQGGITAWNEAGMPVKQEDK